MRACVLECGGISPPLRYRKCWIGTRREDLASPVRREFGKTDPMKRSSLFFPIIIGLIVIAKPSFAAGSETFTGEYADKKFLNGQAVLHISLEQTGNSVS